MGILSKLVTRTALSFVHKQFTGKKVAASSNLYILNWWQNNHTPSDSVRKISFKIILPKPIEAKIAAKRKKSKSIELMNAAKRKEPKSNELINAAQRETRERLKFSAEDDTLILEHVMIYGEKIETWKLLSAKLSRRYWKNIERRYRHELINHSNVRIFTPEEDEIILDTVKNEGRGSKTWRIIAKQLDIDSPDAIKRRHNMLSKKKLQKWELLELSRVFTPEEDEIILDAVEKHGCCSNTWENIANQLDRDSPDSIKCRHEFLTKSKEKKMKTWKLLEDKKLLEILFKVHQLKPNISSLSSVRYGHFADISVELNRTQFACNNHWQEKLLPILKTHILGLPHNIDWIRDFRRHIVDKQIKSVDELNYKVLVDELFPGQTTYSLRLLLTNHQWYKDYLKNKKYNLCDLLSDNLYNPMVHSVLTSDTIQNKRSKYAQDIIQLYESVI